MVQYSDDKVSLKRVYYEGADQLLEGYALCYNRDNIDGDAAAASATRGVNVEQPAAGNLDDFAGVVHASYAGVTGPAWIDLLLPAPWGPAINVYTDQNCTINATLLSVQPGSYALGGADDGRVVAKALQTIDRSTTNGLVQASLGAVDLSTVVSAVSRAATALPTAAIWDNFPLEALRTSKFAGAFLEADFRQAGEAPDRTFTDTTADIVENAVSIGEYTILTSADNDEGACQWDVPIDLDGGNRWGFEARIKILNITDARGTVALGLGFPSALAGDVIADAGAALTDGDFVGFVRFAADGDIVDFIYDEGGQTTNVHDDDYVTVAADTYFTVGMYYNGATIQGYVNGVATGTAISAVDIAAADFPTAAICVPTLAIKGDHVDDISVTLDWIRVAQP
jgi:hypothetical protein